MHATNSHLSRVCVCMFVTGVVRHRGHTSSKRRRVACDRGQTADRGAVWCEGTRGCKGESQGGTAGGDTHKHKHTGESLVCMLIRLLNTHTHTHTCTGAGSLLSVLPVYTQVHPSSQVNQVACDAWLIVWVRVCVFLCIYNPR